MKLCLKTFINYPLYINQNMTAKIMYFICGGHYASKYRVQIIPFPDCRKCEMVVGLTLVDSRVRQLYLENIDHGRREVIKILFYYSIL